MLLFHRSSTSTSSSTSTTSMLVLAWTVLAAVLPGAAAGGRGRLECDPTTVTRADRSRSATCAFAMDMEEDGEEGMLFMSSFSFAGVDPSDGEELIVYTKTRATQRTLGNHAGYDVTWMGSSSSSDAASGGPGGFATLVQTPSGALAGSFRTGASAFVVAPDGGAAAGTLLVRVQETYWVDAMESVTDDAAAADDGEEGAAAGGGGAGGALSDRSDGAMSQAAMTVVMPQSDETIVSEGEAARTIAAPGGANRNLRSSSSSTNNNGRDLQTSITVVDVLILVTNRALCESARQSPGCQVTDSTRANLESALRVVEAETTAGMQDVGVAAAVRFVEIVYLEPGYDAHPSVSALETLRTDRNVAQWRDDAGADLTALITGDDPARRAGGIAYLENPQSVTSWSQFQFYAMNHELYHNLGARHDRGNSQDRHPYGHGLQVPGSLRTVMAYDCPARNCPTIPFLSADGATFNGISIGDGTHNNARRVAEVTPTVAAFRSSKAGNPPPPGGNVGDGNIDGSIKDTGGGGRGWCFSDRTLVLVEGKGPTRMDQLEVGDSVLTSNGFSQVYTFGHLDVNREIDFLQIHTDKSSSSSKALEITVDHMVYVVAEDGVKSRLLPAGQVRPGDLLLTAQGSTEVTRVQTVHRRGLYAPFTATGDIVVNNGVIASNYIALPLALQKRTSFEQQHWLQHAAYVPYRLYCSTGVGRCGGEHQDEATGYSQGTVVWLPLLHWLEKHEGSFLLTAFLYLVALPGQWALLMLEQQAVGGKFNLVHAAAFLLGCWAWRQQQQKRVARAAKAPGSPLATKQTAPIGNPGPTETGSPAPGN